MPILHLHALIRLDGVPLLSTTRRVALTEFAIVNRDHLSTNAQDSGLFGASPSAMLLSFEDGGSIGFAGDIATNATQLNAGGLAVLTNGVEYVAQVGIAGQRVKGLG